MVFKHQLILVSWLLTRSKEQEECTSKAQHAHFLISWARLALLLITLTCIKKFCTRTRELYETEGRAGTLQPLPALLHASPTVYLALMPTQQVGQYVLTYFTWFSLQVALMQSVNKSNSVKALRSCFRFAAPTTAWGQHALHIHFWVCQAAQLCWPMRGEVEGWVSLHTLLWLLIFDITA